MSAIKQLKADVIPPNGPPIILVAARADRGSERLTLEELNAFCKERGISRYVRTSAVTGHGVTELMEWMRRLINWNEMPATVTTSLFKHIKDHVLRLKQKRKARKLVLTPADLKQTLGRKTIKIKFTDDEMLTAVGHLAKHGYVSRLNTLLGEPRILLAPELLNNLAASFVLEARRNVKGLRSLEEDALFTDRYAFPELRGLPKADRDVLLSSAVGMFLKHNVCFRETDPLNGRGYLVFPELINLKKPTLAEESPTQDGVAYTASGAVENAYASLVVLLGYTQTFTRTDQWRDHARYEVGNGLVCGFRLEAERDGELDFVLYFGSNVSEPNRILFQGLFESFLARRDVKVLRFEPAMCTLGHRLNRGVVRDQLGRGMAFSFCPQCGRKISLSKSDQPIQLTRQQAKAIEWQQGAANKRSRFERAMFRLKTFASDRGIASPRCFISYAWGKPEHQQWVERDLAVDLVKGGIEIVLDRWHNAQIGSSIPRFIEQASKCDFVVVVGTPIYKNKIR